MQQFPLDPNIIKANLEAVEERIERAVNRAGRKREEITLVAVTKVFPVDIILGAHAAGLRLFGENFVQEFEGKKPAVTGLEGARFHLIGHLQSNKARRAAELFDVIQTVDTPKLARRLNEYGQDLEVMIEVKLSGEESKRGAAPEDVPQLVESVRGCENLKLTGLMTMPPWSIDPELARDYFIRLRSIAEQHSVKSLSMGMSNDFEVAIEEGATHIRVGSALFGPQTQEEVTVGFHSPLPPAASGVADYSAALLEKLREHLDVAINPINPANVELYHLGNNELHRPIYKRLMRAPGVVVLHDAVLHHFFLGAMTEELYADEFVYNYGQWSREVALELWRSRARSGQDPRYFRYPMLRRAIEAALAVVVHNPAAARMVREHAPQATVVEIPHLFQPPAPPDPVEVIRLRARLGVPAHCTLFGVFGYLRESKRLYSTLAAFAAVRAQAPEAALLIAGRCASSDLERGISPLLDAPGVHRIGYLDESDFNLYSAAVDVCINLRYPAAGETSGIAIRMMGLGKPTLVTAGEAVSRFPEKACIRIDSGPGEREMLADYMTWLTADPAARRTLSEEARYYVTREHAIEKCAAQYADALRSVPQQRTKRQRSLKAH